MDPISAFSLAAAVMQVIDFSISILSKTSQIRKLGTTINLADCAIIAEDVRKRCDRLNATKPSQAATLAESQDDVTSELSRIANAAATIADDIRSALLRFTLSGKKSKWSKFYQVVQIVWGEEKIVSQMARLRAMREELQFHLTVDLNRKVDLLLLKMGTEFSQIDDSTKASIQHILDRPFESTVTQEHYDRLNQRLAQTQEQASQLHQDATKLAIQHHESTMAAIKALPGQISAERGDMIDPIREVQNRLWYTRMADRLDDIEHAHKNTFNWIFSKTAPDRPDHNTFMNWMQKDSGLFWISGRAGCGKSTLMKFLKLDELTHGAFEAWAGGKPLVMTTFFFWNQGPIRLQKSLQGLLRALIFEIIDKVPAFAPILFPDQFKEGRASWDDFPTDQELQRAFKRLVKAEDPPAKIGMIIDGLDEYAASEREHETIAKDLRIAAQTRHLKLVVSSRPENAFEEAFAGCDRIRIHELTSADMAMFASAKLQSHRRWDRLLAAAGGENAARDLIKTLVEKSEGIFLWLELVIRALVDELGSCASLNALHKLLDQLPRGLESLFTHMLQRIPDHERLRGLQLIGLAHRGLELPALEMPWVDTMKAHRPEPALTAVYLSYAQGDNESALNMPMGPQSNHELEDVADRMEFTLRKCCAGLLELRPQTRISERDPEVRFLHKSVAEFLDEPSTRATISDAIQKSGLEVDVSLLRGLVVKLKTLALHGKLQAWGQADATQWVLLERAMKVAAGAELSNPDATVTLLDGIDAAMTHHMPGDVHWSNFFPFDNQLQLLRPGGRQFRLPDAANASTFESFTIANGLCAYARHRGKQESVASASEPEQKPARSEGPRQAPPSPAKRARPLLSVACHPSPYFLVYPGIIRLDVVGLLLARGADPNKGFGDGRRGTSTPWHDALNAARQLRVVGLAGARQLAALLTLLLLHGADPAAPFAWDEFSSGRSLRAPSTHLRTPARQVAVTFVEPFVPAPAPAAAASTAEPWGAGDARLTPFVAFEERVDAPVLFDGRGPTPAAAALLARRPPPDEARAIAAVGEQLLDLIDKKSRKGLLGMLARPRRDPLPGGAVAATESTVDQTTKAEDGGAGVKRWARIFAK